MWGNSGNGEIGDGGSTSTNRLTPVEVTTLGGINLGKVIRIRLIRQMAHKTVIRHILETHSGLIRGCSRYPLVIFLKTVFFMSGFANSVKRNTRENYYKLYLGQPSGARRARRNALSLRRPPQHDLKCDCAQDRSSCRRTRARRPGSRRGQALSWPARAGALAMSDSVLVAYTALRRVQDGARACAAGRLAQVQFVVVFSSISFNTVGKP